MANSKVYQVGTVAKLGSTFNSTIGNTALSSTAITSALVSDTYYAFKDGYTYNANGSQQGTNSGYKVKVVFRLGVPDVAKRTIAVYACAYFNRIDYIGSNNTLSLNMDINGEKGSFSQMCNMTTTWLKTISKSTVLTYNDDGTLPITIDLTGHNETGSCSKVVCKFTVSAPVIEEKNAAVTVTLSETNLTLGSTKCTITHNKHLGQLCTDIILYFKDAANTVIYRKVLYSKNTNDVVDFIPELAIADKLPNEASHTAFVNVRTFDVKDTSTIIGQKNFSVKLIVPSDFKFGITSVEAGSTGLGYVVGQDKPQAIVGINTSKAYSATISKVVVKYNSDTVTYTGSNIPPIVGGKMTFTSDKPFSSSNLSITVTLTDSRGRIVTKSSQIDTDDLTSVPTIKTLNVGRGTGTTLSNWVNNDEGKNCLVKYAVRSNKIKADIANGLTVNSPAITVTVEYKKTSDSAFTQFNYATPANNDGDLEGSFIIPIDDAINAYVIRLTANDGYAVIYRETNLSIGYILAEVHESGKGISFGEKCDTEGFNVNMNTTFKKPVYNAAGSVAITSDESRKIEIDPLEKMFSVEDIMFLFEYIDPISFKYGGIENDKTHMGFSANKIEEVLLGLDKNPSSLSLVERITERIRVISDNKRGEWKENTFLTLKYDELIPLMWLMIKILMNELHNIKTHKEE